MTLIASPAASSAREPLSLAYWERDDNVELIEHTVGALLAERAQTNGNTVALIGTRHGDGAEVRLTYAELYEEAQKVATGLARHTEPGDFVALWSPNVVEWPIIQYGAALAGVVLVALNPVLRSAELEYALSHSGARLLLHADASRGYDMAEVAQRMQSALPDLRIVSLSDREAWRSEIVDADVVNSAPTDPNLPVMLQYTSGTTGKPKGVLLRHRSLVNVAKLTMECVGVKTGSVAVNPLPMFHTAACVIGTLGPLWTGGTEVLIEQFVPETVLETIRRENASVLFYVPAVLGALLEVQRTSDIDPPVLSTIMGGASNVSASMIESAESAFSARVINLFGMTELSPVLSATRRGDSRDDQLHTIGCPLAQVDCKIIDPISGETLPVGTVGEICARGYQQFVEYLHDPISTENALTTDGFVRTGDLGSMDARGYLTLTGRLKELIIRKGENIAPPEIEACLCGHESVLDASVVGIPDEQLGEAVVAVIRVRGTEPADLRQVLLEYVKERLSPHKIPSRWFVAEDLPVTPTGKVQKFALTASIGAGRFRELQ